MKTKTLFFLSAVMSVVILLLIGGVMFTYSLAKADEKVQQAADKPQNEQAANAKQVQVLLQRDAAYQAAIREANARLERANQSIRQLQEQSYSQQPLSADSTQGDGSFPITQGQAEQIALQISGGLNPIKSAELVSLTGKPVYEVGFSQGNIYIDPISGQVIGNTLAAPEISQNEAIRIAENYLGKTSISQVGETSYNGIKVFVINFESGETVLVDKSGQIVMVQQQATPVRETWTEDKEDHED